jgi:predicted AAA+ superfamily ATPase
MQKINTTRIGASYEYWLASELLKRGLWVSIPLVDTGVDLLVHNDDYSQTVAIQVKYKKDEKNIFLRGRESDSYEKKNVILAYFLKDAKYYIPMKEFLRLAVRNENRKDKAVCITVKDHRVELSKFEGDSGLDKLVASMA